jgi:hypothetical protein
MEPKRSVLLITLLIISIILSCKHDSLYYQWNQPVVVQPALKINDTYRYELSKSSNSMSGLAPVIKMIKVIDTFSLNTIKHFVLFTVDSSMFIDNLTSIDPSRFCNCISDYALHICRSETTDTCFESDGGLICTSHEQAVSNFAEIFQSKPCNSQQKFLFNSESLSINRWDSAGDCYETGFCYSHMTKIYVDKIGLLSDSYSYHSPGMTWSSYSFSLVSVNGIAIQR